MTCVRCQTREVAAVKGSTDALLAFYEAEIDRLLALVGPAALPADEVVSRVEHERTVARLNRTIAERNAEIDRLHKVTVGP